MKARIEIFLKNGVLDVQGKAVEGALQDLGWASVDQVRVGKVIEFALNADNADAAQTEAKAMCEKLLANTVIESYRVEIACDGV